MMMMLGFSPAAAKGLKADTRYKASSVAVILMSRPSQDRRARGFLPRTLARRGRVVFRVGLRGRSASVLQEALDHRVHLLHPGWLAGGKVVRLAQVNAQIVKLVSLPLCAGVEP